MKGEVILNKGEVHGNEEGAVKANNTFKITNSVKKEIWNEFVYNHPKGNIFQTPEMYGVYERTKNYEPIFLAVVDESDNIKAMLLAYVIREFAGFLGQFSTRSIIQGGPLYEENEERVAALKVLMEHYDRVVRKKALYTEIRNRWEVSPISNILNDIGYVYEDELNFLIDLAESKEELWANLSKKRRNNIRRALKNGVTVKIVEREDHTYKFYDMLHETYRNAKLPLADISLFRSIFKSLNPKNMAKFFLAKYENSYIGGMLILTYDGVIYDWYAGAHKKYLKVCPNDLLVWHAIEWGSENGYHTFDFGGAGNLDNKEHEGIRDFKKQFGGQLVNFGRYKKIHSPRKLWLAEKGFEVWRKLKL